MLIEKIINELLAVYARDKVTFSIKSLVASVLRRDIFVL
jgi:hypothetical protein